MKLKELTLKNINSFGNKLQTFEFSDNAQLVLLYGDNGVGKTTVSDALSLSLYGKVSGRKLKNIPNRFNKGLQVSANFETSDGKDVLISRSLAPRSFNLAINGHDENTSIDDINVKLERDLIKIPQNVFSNSVLLSLGEFESFVKMRVDKKRKIIDKIFESDIINVMNEKFKVKRKVITDQAADLELKNNSVNDKLESAKTSWDNIVQHVSEEGFNIEETNKQKTEYETTVNSKQIEIAKLDNDWSVRKQTLDTEGTVINNEIVALNNKNIADINNTNQIFDKNATDFSQTVYTNVSAKYTKESNQLAVETSEATKQIEDKQTELTENKTARIKKFGDKYSKKRTDDVQAELDKLNKEKKEHQENVKESELVINKHNNNINAANVANNEANSNIAKNKTNIEFVENKINLYKSGKCGECGTDLTGHEAHSVLSDYEKKLTELRNYEIDLNKAIVQNTKIITDTQQSLIAPNGIVADLINKISQIDYQISVVNSTVISNLKEYYDGEMKIINDSIQTQMDDFKKGVDEKLVTANTRIFEINETVRKEVSVKTTEFNTNNTTEKQKVLSKLKTNYDDNISKQTILQNENKDKVNAEHIAYNITRQGIDNLKNETQRLLDAIILKITQHENNQKLVSDAKKVHDDLEKQQSDIENEIHNNSEKTLRYEILGGLLGEEGIKRSIIRRSLPVFNKSIDYFRNYLEYPYYFQFDENFDVSISQYTYDIDPTELSKGETRLMDLIIILSVFDLIIKKKHNLNIIFMDEIFTSLSKRNIAKVTHLLREYSQKYNINIIIVSHTEVPMEYFDKVYELFKDGDFSDIKEVK